MMEINRVVTKSLLFVTYFFDFMQNWIQVNQHFSELRRDFDLKFRAERVWLMGRSSKKVLDKNIFSKLFLFCNLILKNLQGTSQNFPNLFPT